jgi:putative DNA primase/helicase
MITAEQLTGSAAPLRRACTVTPRRVNWLMPGIPRGKITAVAGQMGQAKSVLTAWLAGRVTTAQGVNLTEPASVLMLSAEDDIDDTIVPRLIAAGASLDRVAFPAEDTLDAERLATQCDELGNVALITIDPVSAFFPTSVNTWRNQDVRRALEPIRRLAQERNIAVVVVQHLNRRADTSEALSRIADSQGIPALARSVLIWGPSPDDPDGDRGDTKVLTRAKGNLARASSALVFRVESVLIGDGIEAPRLVLIGESDVRAEDITSDPETRSRTDEAIAFLRELLADGHQPAENIKAAAREADISDKCLRVARERLCASFRPKGNHGPYHWQLRSEKRMGIQGHSGASTGIHDYVNAVDARECPDAQHLPAGVVELRRRRLDRQLAALNDLPDDEAREAEWQRIADELDALEDEPA